MHVIRFNFKTCLKCIRLFLKHVQTKFIVIFYALDLYFKAYSVFNPYIHINIYPTF